ncbi:MAG: RluA family pseudouridine synthase [Pseudomonadota bacterium]
MQEKTKVQYIPVGNEHAGRRLDNFIFYKFKYLPKSLVYRLLRQGEIRVNKKRRRPDYRLAPDDELRVAPIRSEIMPEKIKPSARLIKQLETAPLFENDTIIIINKPAGVAVHSGSGIHCGLIEALRQIYDYAYLELAHRLDRDTSGCLILAKKPSALREIHSLLQQGDIEKTYLALTLGHWRHQKNSVDIPLKKFILQSGERMVKANPDGKAAKTIFYPLENFAASSLVRIRLLTGRTHQIRVHAQYAGHPLAGDKKYGDKAFNQISGKQGLKRLFLHAHHLRFTLNNEQIDVQYPLDNELQQFINKLD